MLLHGFEESREVACLDVATISGLIGRNRSDPHFALTGPLLQILDFTSPTDMNVFPGFYEHITGGYNVNDWRMAGMLSRDPDRHRNVIGGIAIGDREQSVNTKEELGAPVIVRWARQ